MADQPSNAGAPETPAPQQMEPAAVSEGQASAPPEQPSGRGGGGGGGGGRGGRGGRGGGRGGRGGDRRGGRGGEESGEGAVDDVLVKLYRCATVVKGGRRFSFGALVVVGDRNGRVGFGYGKANEVPQAVEKGVKQAKRQLKPIPLRGTTIPHRVMGRFGASKIALIPAGPGTGVIAGSAARAVLELAGIKDVLTKAYGSTSPKNLVKATLEGLLQLRSRTTVEQLRGVEIDLPKEPAVAAVAAASE